MVDDDKTMLSCVGICYVYLLVLLVYDSHQLEGDFVLEINRKIGKEEDAFLDDPNIGLEYEVLLDCGVDILQEIYFLIFVERGCFRLVILSFDIVFHFLAQLRSKLIVVFQFSYGLLVVIVLFVLAVDVVDCNSYHVDHVAKERCSAYLDQHYD